MNQTKVVSLLSPCIGVTKELPRFELQIEHNANVDSLEEYHFHVKDTMNHYDNLPRQRHYDHFSIIDRFSSFS